MTKPAPTTGTASPRLGSTLSTPMTDRFAECVFGVELVNASLARQLERDRARLIAVMRYYAKDRDESSSVWAEEVLEELGEL